jgi:hypothetical protein
MPGKSLEADVNSGVWSNSEPGDVSTIHKQAIYSSSLVTIGS